MSPQFILKLASGHVKRMVEESVAVRTKAQKAENDQIGLKVNCNMNMESQNLCKWYLEYIHHLRKCQFACVTPFLAWFPAG
jgi:hypothetical protein